MTNRVPMPHSNRPSSSHPMKDRPNTKMFIFSPSVIALVSWKYRLVSRWGFSASRYGIIKYSYDLTKPGIISSIERNNRKKKLPL